MIRLLTIITVLTAVSLASEAQTTLSYKVSFPQYEHHEAQIQLSVHQAPEGPLTFRMSRSSPGRYATHEFGKNVYNVKAMDVSGKALEVRRLDGDIYQVKSHGTEFTLQYTLFGDYVDGTYVGIDRTHAHFNMPGTIMWGEGLDKAPIKITFDIPQGLTWKIATQLRPTADPNTFTAPDLQYLMDCPTELSDFHLATWQETNTDGGPLTFRFTLHATIADAVWDTLVSDVKRLLEEERKVFGEFASFDYGTYTFILDANAYDHGDGMEHRNSTCITLPMKEVGSPQIPRILDVCAHEFFHSWNVKRLRPKTIEPFNFTKSNMSNELWVAEGFTQYYGNLLLARAGFNSKQEEIALLGHYLDAFMTSPGALNYTPIWASQTAIFADAGVSIDKNNFSNTFFSYYYYGANIACILDLHLRKDFHKSLDDYMKALWVQYGKVGRWYDVADLETTLASMTSKAYAHTFFANYVYGFSRDNWDPYFAYEGLQVVNAGKGKASLGRVSLKVADDGHVAIERGAVIGTPIYNAGLDIGDEVLTIDGKTVASVSDITDFLASASIGQKVSIGFLSRGVQGSVSVTLGEAQQYGLQPLSADSTSYQTLQQAWLGAQ
jgi:predicted metalloprotease with PDZ domain